MATPSASEGEWPAPSKVPDAGRALERIALADRAAWRRDRRRAGRREGLAVEPFELEGLAAFAAECDAGGATLETRVETHDELSGSADEVGVDADQTVALKTEMTGGAFRTSLDGVGVSPGLAVGARKDAALAADIDRALDGSRPA